MNTSLHQRIRWYVYFFSLLSLGLFAQWSWWMFPERELFEVYRDMGFIECLQVMLWAFLGLSFCYLGRDSFSVSGVRTTIVDASFGQFTGMVSFLMIFRESDYLMTYFMDEPLFLRIWTVLIVIVALYGVRNVRDILTSTSRLFRSRSSWVFISGATVYFVIAQVIGAKQFRAMFYPEAVNFSRRFIEENLELAGLLLFAAGVLELYFMKQQGIHENKEYRTVNTRTWTDDLWRALKASSSALPGYRERNDRSEKVQTAIQKQVRLQSGPVDGDRNTDSPDEIRDRVEELQRVVKGERRSNAGLPAAILFVGTLFGFLYAWHVYIQREMAIDRAADSQMEILAEQYKSQLDRAKEKEREKKRKKEQPQEPPFRFQELRSAIREDVAQEYKIEKLFKQNPHR